MSVISNVLDCPDLQVPIDEAFARDWSRLEPLPFLEYLNSEPGRAGLTLRMLPGGNKVRRVEVSYFQRDLENETTTNVANPNCGAGDEIEELSTVYDIDTTANIARTKSWTVNDFSRSCKASEFFIYSEIAKMLDVVDRAVATAMANYVVANLVGKWASDTLNQDGTTITNPNLVVATKLANGNIDPTLYTTIEMARQVTGYPGGFAFTNQNIWRYAKLAETGCCVVDQGVDFAAQLNKFGTVFAWDRRVENALSTNADGLYIVPGSLAFIPYVASEWGDNPEVDRGSNYLWRTLFTPRGMPVDFTIKNDCGKVNMSVVATPHLRGMPEDLFKVGDVFEGVKGVNTIKITNPA